MVATAARYGAAVSLSTGSHPSVNAAIGQTPDTAWTPIHYPNAFVDDETGQLVSDTEVTEIGYLAFRSHPKKRHVHGRLIVRRVKRPNPTPGQNGLFDAWSWRAGKPLEDYADLTDLSVRGRVSEAGVAAVEVGGQVVVEDAGADLKQEVGAAGGQRITSGEPVWLVWLPHDR